MEKNKSQKAATTTAHESSDSESNGLIAGDAMSVSIRTNSVPGLSTRGQLVICARISCHSPLSIS